MGLLGQLLQAVELGISGLVHKEHPMDFQRLVGKQGFYFLESAHGHLGGGILVADGPNYVLGAGTVKAGPFCAAFIAEAATFKLSVLVVAKTHINTSLCRR